MEPIAIASLFLIIFQDVQQIKSALGLAILTLASLMVLVFSAILALYGQ